MDAMHLDAMCVFYPARITYLTGFHHVPTERPIALVLGPNAYSALVVPAVEKEHAETIPGIDRLDVYFEYPGSEHPMERLGVALAEVSAQPERIGADHDGFVPYWGYRGPGLTDITGRTPVDAEMLVEALRRVKSPSEIECIQLSCDWAARAHRRMQDSIVTGKTEMECYGPAAARFLEQRAAGDVRGGALDRHASWLRSRPWCAEGRRSGHRRGRRHRRLPQRAGADDVRRRADRRTRARLRRDAQATGARHRDDVAGRARSRGGAGGHAAGRGAW